MRLAWFSPLPPVGSGIAAYSAELLPELDTRHVIDRYVDGRSGTPLGSARNRAFDPERDEPLGRVCDAHDFVWRHQRRPYDLVVYHLGNAPCHDYMWAYLVNYPGAVVLHDAHLHQARARRLLERGRPQDYREEFRHDHPEATPDFAQYAVEGLGGPIYYFWSMLRVVIETARLVAVHNPRVADDLREQFQTAAIETIAMGVPETPAHSGARERIRRQLGCAEEATVFAAFGKVTAEKRIGPILRALGAIIDEGTNAHLMLVGDQGECGSLAGEIAGHGVSGRVHVTGYVADQEIGDYLAAADAFLCLRWPTTEETSASWLRCLAAARPTVLTDLAHLVDIPALDPRSWRATGRTAAPVAISIDLLDEEHSLRLAMRRLAADKPLRAELARAGHQYWKAHHTLSAMVADYERMLRNAQARAVPRPINLPSHFTRDHSEAARERARQFGVEVDVLRERLAR